MAIILGNLSRAAIDPISMLIALLAVYIYNNNSALIGGSSIVILSLIHAFISTVTYNLAFGLSLTNINGKVFLSGLAIFFFWFVVFYVANRVLKYMRSK